MFKLGDYNKLKIDRSTSVGMFLTDGEGNDVLLPNKYVQESFDIGDEITVFLYKDFEQRWVATTLTPWIKINEFACLRVRNATDKGAFLECGLEKDIFVPHREQSIKMKDGHKYVVYLYEDKQTNRLVASSKINRYLNNEDLEISAGDEVDLLIYETTPLGFNTVINQTYKGLIYHTEIFEEVRVGSKMKGYIKSIREDNTIDVSLQPKGIKQMEYGAAFILSYLKKHQGLLNLSDKSAPEEIASLLKMSKKNFKRSIGILYKQKLILIHEKNITLA